MRADKATRKYMLRGGLAIAIGLGAAALAQTASASEYGLSTYPLGSQTSMTGFTPPPGLYVTDTVIVYQGDAADKIDLPLGARIAAGVEEDILVNALTVSVFPDVRIAEGQIGFALTVPYGGVGVDADATFSNLGVPLGAASDDETGLGDIQLTALIGWKQEVHNWNLAATAILPTGEYDSAQLANVGLNRPGFDIKGGYTYMNPENGFEFSTGLGFTFNGENDDTDYKSGTDFHLEASLTQHFPNGWAVGVGGYHYQQLTGDSGAGAILGDFEGSASAFGPMASYTFKVGPAPVQISAKWFHEFHTENRARGDTVLFGLTMPLAAFGQPPAN